MPAYFVGKIKVTDLVRYAEYIKATPPVIAKFGGRFIARGGQAVTLEGPEVTDRMVIIEFPSVAAAQDFYHSPEYAKAKALREGAAEAQFVVVDGVSQA